ERAKTLQKRLVVARKQHAWVDPLAVGLEGDGRTVRVAARDHQHAVAAQALIAREDVRGQICARNMPQVRVAVRVRPRDGHQNVFVHEPEFNQRPAYLPCQSLRRTRTTSMKLRMESRTGLTFETEPYRHSVGTSFTL